MKLFRKLKAAVKTHKKLSAVVLTAMVIAAPVAAHAGFFPGRQTFDYNNYNGNNNCADQSNPARNNGRCGSLTGPVFDSFINTPTYGDERSFFDGYRTDLANGNASDPVTNVTDGSQVVTLRVYVHNNANSSTNCHADHLDANGNCTVIDHDAPGIAHNTKVAIALPASTTVSNDLRSVASISADNSNPGTVYDTADLTSSKNFTVSYVPGSAIEYNDGPFKGGQQLSDSIVNGGAPIGYDALNGDLPGCFPYAATVEIKVKVTPVTPPNNHLTITKTDRLAGSTTWGHQVNAKPGDTVQWELDTENKGTSTLTNVTTSDVLPPNLQVVAGSIKFVNARGTEPLSDTPNGGPLFGGGYNAGSYNPNDNTLITFDTKVLDNFDGCTIIDRNTASAVSDQTPKASDNADVVITKTNCTPPPSKQTLTCDLLAVTPGDNRTATFTATASVTGNAKINAYQYDFGDGTPVLLTDKTSVTHTYAKDGQFASHVSVLGQVNGKNQTVTSAKCASAVTFTTPPVTPPSTPGTPGQPTSLVNTGPGSVAALFTVATLFGAAVYHRVLSRRLSRQ